MSRRVRLLRFQNNLHAVVFFVTENFVSVRRLFQREAMSDGLYGLPFGGKERVGCVEAINEATVREMPEVITEPHELCEEFHLPQESLIPGYSEMLLVKFVDRPITAPSERALQSGNAIIAAQASTRASPSNSAQKGFGNSSTVRPRWYQRAS